MPDPCRDWQEFKGACKVLAQVGDVGLCGADAVVASAGNAEEGGLVTAEDFLLESVVRVDDVSSLSSIENFILPCFLF